MASQPPLTYVASASASNPPAVSDTLPHEVVTCLKNARFLHLATCDAQTPHVSLMNYTYLSHTPFTSGPTIIMTTNPASQKTQNLRANPRVSLLVHDWVSHRPPTRTQDPTRGGSPPPNATRSTLATMLLNMNTSEMSRISATINGDARILESDSEEEKWCKEMHLENNTFGSEGPQDTTAFFGTSPGVSFHGQNQSDGGRGYFIATEEVQVVVVKIRDGRIADWKGGIQDWVISAPEREQTVDGGSQLPNGVME